MTVVVPGTASDFPLTGEQQAVVDSDAPALVARASAGTGKTEILVRRAERFVNDPKGGNAHVLVITYTTRAADEFKSRLRGRIGGAMQRIVADTVHGFARSILTTHGTHIGLPTDVQVITRDEDRAELLAEFDPWVPLDDYPDLFRGLDRARATCDDHPYLKIWRKTLEHAGAVDFSEMIAKATEVLRIPAFSRMLRVIYGSVIVDEAQNLTEQQYQLIVALVGQHSDTRLPLVPTTLLGDPNQSVTGFAGGDSALMQRFADDFGAQEFMLTQNFRSSQCLASLERVVSLKLDGRHPRPEVQAERIAEGSVHRETFPSEADEGSFVADWAARLLEEGLPPEAVSAGETCRVRAEEIAVLARHSATLDAAAEALTEHGYEVARAHSEDDFMATATGAVALLLMRYRSARHRLAAMGELRRKLEFSESDLIPDDSDAADQRLAESLRARGDEHLDILVPLLEVGSPAEFVTLLEQCHLPQTAPDEVLAGWPADRRLIGDTWSEFISLTPVADRSWTRFALHFDWIQRARDLGQGIRLITVHKAQGREFKAVAVVGMNDGQFPDYRASSEDAHQAELQAFYVAVTRASRVLVLTRALERPTRYGPRSTEPSPFLQLVETATATP